MVGSLGVDIVSLLLLLLLRFLACVSRFLRLTIAHTCNECGIVCQGVERCCGGLAHREVGRRFYDTDKDRLVYDDWL